MPCLCVAGDRTELSMAVDFVSVAGGCPNPPHEPINHYLMEKICRKRLRHRGRNQCGGNETDSVRAQGVVSRDDLTACTHLPFSLLFLLLPLLAA